jgi:hypothetical protein
MMQQDCLILLTWLQINIKRRFIGYKIQWSLDKTSTQEFVNKEIKFLGDY